MASREYEVKRNDEKGKHIVAVSTFAPGGIVIKEAPLLSVTVSGSTDGLFDEADDPTPASQQAKAKFSQAIRNLQSRDVEEYAKFQALFYHLPQQPQGTITTVPQRRQPLRSSRRAITEKEDLSRASHNAFSETFVDNDGHTKTALRIFNDISRFNHSCRPNAHYYWDETQQRGVVRATERISPGTEITITYISDEGFNNAATRQDFYNEHYHFTCQCIACGGEQICTTQQTRDGRTTPDTLEAEEKFAKRPDLLVHEASELVKNIEYEQIAGSRYVEALYLYTFIAYRYGSPEDAHDAAGKAMRAERVAYGDSVLMTEQYGETFLQTVLDYKGSG